VPVITPASVETQSDELLEESHPDPRSCDTEFGAGTWDEFQAARRRYLGSVGNKWPEGDPEEALSER
jgi:hypothetical protein